MARKSSSALTVCLITGALVVAALGTVSAATYDATVNSSSDLHGYGWAARHGDWSYVMGGKLAHPMLCRCDLTATKGAPLTYANGKPMICTQGGTLLPE